MAYADYQYYKDVYLGSQISEQDFPRLAERATEFVRYMTRGKSDGQAELDAVKSAVCAAAEQQQMLEVSAQGTLESGGELASETVGSWSQSFRSADEVAKGAYAQMAAAVSRYLTATGLLYRGRGCICR